MKAFIALPATLVAALALLLAFVSPAAATYSGSNDGRLVFSATVDGNTDIYTVLPNGEDMRRLTDSGGLRRPRLFGGRQIDRLGLIGFSVGTSPSEIWVMKQNGTEKRQVTNLGATLAFPDFSPDGSQIVFQYKTPATRQQLWLVNSDGSDAHLLSASTGNDRLAAFSPDSTQIVFISDRTGLPQLWLMNADGSNQTQLTYDLVPKDQLPDWRPDGKRIAFVERTAPSGGDIWRIDPDGSNPEPLTSAADDLGTAWSPDGTRIAYLNWTTAHRRGNERGRQRPPYRPPTRNPDRPRLATTRRPPRHFARAMNTKGLAPRMTAVALTRAPRPRAVRDRRGGSRERPPRFLLA